MHTNLFEYVIEVILHAYPNQKLFTPTTAVASMIASRYPYTFHSPSLDASTVRLFSECRKSQRTKVDTPRTTTTRSSQEAEKARGRNMDMYISLF
jgi:hypothetical protein